MKKIRGEQAQVDWKDDISITNIYVEKFVINILHTTLKYSRYSHLEMIAQKRFDDVARGLINSFRKFGSVPKKLLFDNMATVSNTNVTPKKPTDSIMQMAKDWGLYGQREVIHSKNSNEPDRSISLTAELPFDTAKED